MAGVRLTEVQAAELGLPPGDYEIRGEIQPVDGQPLKLPDLDTLRVPARWLYPGDADRLDLAADLTATPTTDYGPRQARRAVLGVASRWDGSPVGLAAPAGGWR